MEKWSFKKIKSDLEKKEVRFEHITHQPLKTMVDVVNALDVEEEKMAKTVVLNVYGDLVAVLLPGAKRLNYTVIARVLGVNRNDIKFATPKDLASAGLSIGSISPFSDVFKDMLIDEILLTQDYMYCGSGDEDKTLKISPSNFLEVISPIIIS